MTVVNPKSISGITSITTASGSDNLLTIHTSDANNTERFRIDSTGSAKVGSGVTLSPDGHIFVTGITTVGKSIFLSGNNPNIRFDDSDTTNNGEITLDNTQLRIEVDEDNSRNSSQIKFRVDGDDIVSILSTGLQFTATTPELEFNNGGPRFRVPAANTLSVFTSGGIGSTTNERIRITSGGVSLFGGLTAQADVVDTSKLAVQGGNSNIGIIQVHAGGGETAGDLSGIAFSHGNDDSTARPKGAIAFECNGSGYGRGDLCFYVDDAGDNNQVAAADERLRITHDGKIGINDTDPDAKLEIRDADATGIIVRCTNTQTTDTNKALRVRNNSDTDTFSVSHKGLVTATTVEDSIGDLRKFPVTNYGSNVVVASHHAGKTLTNTSGGWTVNADTDFAIGEVMRVVNKSGSSQTVFQGGTATLYSSRDNGTSGDHSIKARGSAILICTGGDEYYLSGDI